MFSDVRLDVPLRVRLPRPGGESAARVGFAAGLTLALQRGESPGRRRCAWRRAPARPAPSRRTTATWTRRWPRSWRAAPTPARPSAVSSSRGIGPRPRPGQHASGTSTSELYAQTPHGMSRRTSGCTRRVPQYIGRRRRPARLAAAPGGNAYTDDPYATHPLPHRRLPFYSFGLMAALALIVPACHRAAADQEPGVRNEFVYEPIWRRHRRLRRGANLVHRRELEHHAPDLWSALFSGRLRLVRRPDRRVPGRAC